MRNVAGESQKRRMEDEKKADEVAEAKRQRLAKREAEKAAAAEIEDGFVSL